MASSHPPPSATPFTAAMTGSLKPSIRRKRRCQRWVISSASEPDSRCSSRMSAPAAKARSPLPVSTTTEASRSPSVWSSASPSSRPIWALSTFRGGWSIVIVTTPPSCSMSIRSDDMQAPCRRAWKQPIQPGDSHGMRPGFRGKREQFKIMYLRHFVNRKVKNRNRIVTQPGREIGRKIQVEFRCMVDLGYAPS